MKTHDESGRKVFINMCGHLKVAAPGNWAGGKIPEEVAAALENADNLTSAEVCAALYCVCVVVGQPARPAAGIHYPAQPESMTD